MGMIGVDSDVRLEILRLLAELDNPVGADSLAAHLEERGINLTPDAVRYHLRMLDQGGFTSRIGKRGRILTQQGWGELQRSRVDTRMGVGLARHELMAQQVTFEPATRRGKVAGSLTIFPQEERSRVLKDVARACRAGLSISDMVALVESGERIAGVSIPPGKMGIFTLATSTITGILASRGFLLQITYVGVVEVVDWRPYRFVDVLRYGSGSLDSVEILIRSGRTRLSGLLERGHGLAIADVRELVSVTRDRVKSLLNQIRDSGLGGVLMVGQVGQPVLGIPVRDHTFGLAVLGGINPALVSYEAGVGMEFHLVECLVEYSSLTPAEQLLSEAERKELAVCGALLPTGRPEA